MIKIKETYKLVFTVSEHETLGYLFESWVVSMIQEDQMSLSFRKVNKTTVKDYDIAVSKAEYELLENITEYSDESITRRFSKNTIKSSDFLKNPDPKVLSQLIRPFIEKRMARCYDLILDNHIPLHFKGKRKDAIRDEAIHVAEDEASAVFHFERGEDGIRYFITLRSGSKNLGLFNKDARILVNKPCILLLGGSLYKFKGNIDGNKLSPFISKEFIHVPKSTEMKYFSSFVHAAIDQYEVNAKGFDVLSPVYPCEPLLCLEQDLSAGPVLKLKFRYGPRDFLYHDPAAGSTEMEQDGQRVMFLKIRRDKEAEEKAITAILSTGLVNGEGSFFRLPETIPSLVEQEKEVKRLALKELQEAEAIETKHKLISWISMHKAGLEKSGITVVQDQLKERYFTGNIRVDMSMKESNDWFDVHAVVFFGNAKVPFIKLRHHILNNIREYALPDGSLAILPEEWFAKYRDLARLGNVSGDGITLKRHHFGLIKELAGEKNGNGLVDYESIIRNRKLEDIRIPDGLNARLRPYQAEGFQWMNIMQQLQLGGVLADDMGLGKTLQTLVMLMHSKKTNLPAQEVQETPPDSPSKQLDLFAPAYSAGSAKTRTSLIVMPLSLIHNWINEVTKFTSGLRTYVHSGQDRVQDPKVFLNYDIVLTTYGIIRNDLDMFRQIEFWYIILDESQLIKNPQSKLFRSVKQLRSKHKLVLTGTPIENSLVDLWAQLTFLNEGLLGNLNYFKEEYVVPIEKNKDPQKEEKLQRMIGPFILRRTKEMVARDLPSLSEQVYYCEMSEAQRNLYEERKSEIRNTILENITKLGTDRSRFVILKGLMQLRLLANHPMLYTGNVPDETDLHGIPSGKFEEVIRNLENLHAEGHKVLIYSQFVKHLRLFRDYFEKQGYRYSMLTGQTITDERQQVIREFQEEDDRMFFLITLKAGGVGLNLTAAEYVFLLDPWWNPAVENQAVSRAHRIGQEKKVFSYKFITRDTIEEKILQLQSRKSELASLFISNNNPLRFFTKESIVKLIE